MNRTLALLAVCALLFVSCGSADGTADSAAGAAESSVVKDTAQLSETVDATSDTETDATADTQNSTTDESSNTTDAAAPAVDDTDAGASDLTWTVVGVDSDDTLNVRAEPNASATIVGELDPWSTDFAVTGDNGTPVRWREITLADGTDGWVNARFVIGQPDDLSAEQIDDLADQTTAFLAWLDGENDGDASELFLSDRALWMSSRIGYRDIGKQWDWVAGSDLSTTSAWNTEREFPNYESECFDCAVTVMEYLELDTVDDTSEILVNEPGDLTTLGALSFAPELHRVSISTPGTEEFDGLDWQMLHLVHDWSSGEPRVHLIQENGWEP
ncbi:MAG: SH3 domain-containing protein [Actinomycetota bacterium]